jgi:sRNA-binding carbon storage regulator CsrA
MPHLILKADREKRVGLFLGDQFLGYVSIFFKHGHIKLSFECPRDVVILREELMSLAQLELAEDALNS